jgi:Tfp pilus assembly protein PilX
MRPPASSPVAVARPRVERGSVLIVTLLVLAMLALGVGSYLSLNLNTARLARRNYQQNAAFHLAEAGAEEAVWSLNRMQARAPDAWTGWTTRQPAAWRKFTGFDLGSGTTGSVKVYVSDTQPAAGSKPVAVAQATVESAGLPASTRMLELTLGRRSYFSNGIVARETVKFAGQNVSVDSWNSDPDGDPATAPVPYSEAVRNDRGSIATAAVENKAMLVNQTAVWGYVATGGAAPEVGVNGSIRGADTPPDVMIDPARVTTDFVVDLPLLGAPVDGTPIPTVGETLGVIGLATKWRCPAVALSGNQTLTILGQVTLVLTVSTGSALDVTGKASIIIPDGSSLTLYAEADIKIAGNGLANANSRPMTCRIYGTSNSPAGQAVHVTGNGALKAAVYAPNGDVQVNGNGDIMGSVVGREVTFTGNARFHYDESLADEGDDTPFKVTRWRELTNPADRAKWQPLFTGW